MRRRRPSDGWARSDLQATMNLCLRIWRSTVGRKAVMALTGAALFLFLVGHLLGNLQVFGPPELINQYAHFLKSKPGLVWGARLGLLACVGLHILAAVTLARANRAARPVAYASGPAYGSTFRSRTMLLSGSVILAFVVYHLLHFTALQPGINGYGDFSRLKAPLGGEMVPDVYAMMVLGFRVWWVAAFYLLAQALLFLHLGHGLASMFQSMGWRSYAWWPRVERFAQVASLLIFLGYASIPVSVLAGLGRDYARDAEQRARVEMTEGKGVVR